MHITIRWREKEGHRILIVRFSKCERKINEDDASDEGVKEKEDPERLNVKFARMALE